MLGSIIAVIALVLVVKLVFRWVSRPVVHVAIPASGPTQQIVIPYPVPVPYYAPPAGAVSRVDEDVSVDDQLYDMIDGYYLEHRGD